MPRKYTINLRVCLESRSRLTSLVQILQHNLNTYTIPSAFTKVLKKPHFFNLAAKAHASIFQQPHDMTRIEKLPLQKPWHSDFCRPPKPHQTFKQAAREKLREQQKSTYELYQHGSHYRQFRPSISTDEFVSDLHNYMLSKVLLRLRSGHSRLAAHNKTTEDSQCRCGADETVEHVLLYCDCTRSVTQHRHSFLESIRAYITFEKLPTVKQLLSPAPQHSHRRQREFFQKVAQFAMKLPHEL